MGGRRLAGWILAIAGGLVVYRSATSTPPPEATVVGYRGWSGPATGRRVHFDPGRPLAIRISGPRTPAPTATLTGAHGRRPLELTATEVEGGTVWRWTPDKVDAVLRGTLEVTLDGVPLGKWPAELGPDVATRVRAALRETPDLDAAAAHRHVDAWPTSQIGVHGRALADLYAGIGLFVAGRPEAEAWFERVAADAHTSGHGSICAGACNMLTEFAWRRGAFDEAVSLIRRARACLPREDEISAEQLELQEAHVLSATGRLPVAIGMARSSLARARANGRDDLARRYAALLADLLTKSGRADLAFGLLAETLSSDSTRAPTAKVNAAWTLVEAIEQGLVPPDWSRAQTLFEEAHAAFVDAKQARFLDNVRVNLAYVLARRGRNEESARWLSFSNTDTSLRRPDVRGLALATEAYLALNQGRDLEVVVLADRAPPATRLGGARMTWRLVSAAATAQVRLGRVADAKHRLLRALGETDEDGVPLGHESVAKRILRRRLSALLLEEGRIAEAFDVQARGHAQRLRGLRLATALQKAPADTIAEWSGFVGRGLDAQRALAELDATCRSVESSCEARRSELVERTQSKLQYWLQRLDIVDPPPWTPDPRDLVVTAAPETGVLWRRDGDGGAGEVEALLASLETHPPRHVYWLGPVAPGRDAETYAKLARGIFGGDSGATLSVLPALVGPRSRGQGASALPMLVVGDPREDLPRAEEEALRVAEAVPGTRLLLGAHATRRAIEEAWPRTARLHFAGHARMVEAGLSGPHLDLADHDRLGPLDVLLLSARFSMVVLSGCDTAGGDRGGSSLLPEAFWTAGARVVVALRGPVEDHSALQSMVAFYAAGGARTPLQALRHTVRRRPEMAARIMAWGHPMPGGTLN